MLRNTIEAESERKAALSIPRLEEKRIINPKAIAIKKFESGPAAETISSPHLWFFRLYGLYGTGFAQPKRNPAEK